MTAAQGSKSKAVKGALVLFAVLVAIVAAPATGAAQSGVNAAGAQYLPAGAGGGGTRPEAALAGGRDSPGRSGFKVSESSPGPEIGLLFPLALVASLLATSVIVVWSRSGGPIQGSRADDR